MKACHTVESELLRDIFNRRAERDGMEGIEIGPNSYAEQGRTDLSDGSARVSSTKSMTG